jgi:hypothetical protein
MEVIFLSSIHVIDIRIQFGATVWFLYTSPLYYGFGPMTTVNSENAYFEYLSA